MSRLLGIVVAALAAVTLGVGIAGSETAKAVKKSEAVTLVPTPTPMPAGKPGATLNVMLREDRFAWRWSRAPSPSTWTWRPSSSTS